MSDQETDMEDGSNLLHCRPSFALVVTITQKSFGFLRKIACPMRSLFVVLLIILASTPAFAQRSAQVGVDLVRVEPMQQKMAILGRFIARNSGNIATRIAERVDKTLVEVGSRVTAGTPLVRLASDRLRARRELRAAELRRAQAKVVGMRAALLKTKQAQERLTKLRGSTAFRADRQEDLARDVEEAASELAEAEAQADRAEAELQLAKTALADTVIRAPYPGVVISRHVTVGSFVRAGESVVTLLNDSDLEIEADVPADRLGGLTEGTLIDAKLADGTTLTAAVRAIIPDENPRTRSRAVRMIPALVDGQSMLADKQTVTLMIPIASARDVVTVHKDAVLAKGAGRIVYLAENGKAILRPLVLGDAVGNRFEVRKGLKAGDPVVVRGNERLRPNAGITIVGPKS